VRVTGPRAVALPPKVGELANDRAWIGGGGRHGEREKMHKSKMRNTIFPQPHPTPPVK